MLVLSCTTCYQLLQFIVVNYSGMYVLYSSIDLGSAESAMP